MTTYNTNNLKKYLTNILDIHSPSGYTDKAMEYFEEELAKLGATYNRTNKGALIVTIEGENKEDVRTLSAHVDTLGAMIKTIKDNGTLELSQVGGYMMNTLEGENCIIETIEGTHYTGTVQTIKPSVHISGGEARELKREPSTMEVVIDEKVSSKEDLEKLGICVGDYVFIETRSRITDSGFIKSRYLDDKASAAILLYTIEYILANKIQLPYTTCFFISNYEEVGHGAAYIPENTKEFVSVDMGAPGLTQNSSEFAVCICAKDSSGPYDYELKKKFVDICKKNNIDYKIDIYPYYGSDASCARGAGHDIRCGLIGPGVFASHGYERTHMDAMIATLDLVVKYISNK